MKTIYRSFLSLLLATSLQAGSLFQQGNVSVGVNAGSGSVHVGVSKDYFVIGVRGDFFIYDNLSVGIGVSSWLGDDPTITEVTLPVTYYFDTNMRFYPYLGGFYRYSYYSGDYNDLSYTSVGGRAGISYSSGRGYAGVGVIGEYNVDTGESRFDPEMFVGIMF
ncbi:MAG: hypothetical protein GXO11_08300 [Epsilonproteobacteria bacterium]|nr:hypothetical protein [Campylobacterota bacterium]